MRRQTVKDLGTLYHSMRMLFVAVRNRDIDKDELWQMNLSRVFKENIMTWINVHETLSVLQPKSYEVVL